MRHGRRSVLTTEDVNSALRLRNVEVRGRWQRRVARVDFSAGLRLPPRSARPHHPRSSCCSTRRLTVLPAVQPVYGFFGGAEPVEVLKADGVPNL